MRVRASKARAGVSAGQVCHRRCNALGASHSRHLPTVRCVSKRMRWAHLEEWPPSWFETARALKIM